VQDVGEGVTRFKQGDRVVVEVMVGCGECVYCNQGFYNVCQNRTIFWGNGHGGFAEFTTAHESTLYKIPDEMTFEQGSLVEPLAVCYRSMMLSGATSQSRVAIMGGGTIGLLNLAVAKTMGVKETLIVVKYPQQAKLAEIYGADHIIDVSDESDTNVQESCRDITKGMGFDVVIETTASESGFNDSVEIVRIQGTIVLVGVYTQPRTVNLNRIVGQEINIKGSMCYSHSGIVDDVEATIDLIATGKVDPTQLITHRLPLDEIVEGFKIADDKSTGSIKVNIHQ
jgi:2-desacetyl-2-hydroxyethyl bacteriochlorophyllide A dehydrogenase